MAVGQFIGVNVNKIAQGNIIFEEFFQASVSVFLGKIECIVETISEIDCFFGQLEGSDINQMLNTGKGVEVYLNAVYQETLLGTSCGKGRKIYQVFLNSWVMFFERRGGGGEAVGVS